MTHNPYQSPRAHEAASQPIIRDAGIRWLVVAGILFVAITPCLSVGNLTTWIAARLSRQLNGHTPIALLSGMWSINVGIALSLPMITAGIARSSRTFLKWGKRTVPFTGIAYALWLLLLR